MVESHTEETLILKCDCGNWEEMPGDEPRSHSHSFSYDYDKDVWTCDGCGEEAKSDYYKKEPTPRCRVCGFVPMGCVCGTEDAVR